MYFTPVLFHSTWHSPINDDRYLQLGSLHVESYMPLGIIGEIMESEVDGGGMLSWSPNGFEW